jgi:hypothetical protein
VGKGRAVKTGGYNHDVYNSQGTPKRAFAKLTENETDQIDETDEIDEMDETDEMNQVDEFDGHPTTSASRSRTTVFTSELRKLHRLVS